MLIAGIDIGSGTTKCVLVDEGRQVRGRGQVKTKADFEKVSREAMEAACADAGAGADAVGYVATTGLGRYAVPFRDIQITDLTCGARGAATWALAATEGASAAGDACFRNLRRSGSAIDGVWTCFPSRRCIARLSGRGP